MRRTPVGVCAKTSHLPSSSARSMKYVSLFTWKSNVLSPEKTWPRIYTIFTDLFHPCGSVPIRGRTALLFVFDVHVLGVDYAFVFLLTRRAVDTGLRARACARTGLGSALRLSSLVHLLSEFVRSLGQVLAGAVHLRFVIGLERLLRIRQRVFDVAAFGARDLVAVLLQHLLDVVDHRVELVLGL